MNDFELRSQLRELRVEREPTNDLWQAIAARIDSQPKPLRRHPWLALALAASASLMAILLAMQPQVAPSPRAVDAGPPRAAAQQLLPITAEGLAKEYAAALASRPDAEVPAELAATALVLDQSIDSLRAALQQQPESTFLLQQLRRVHGLRLQLSQSAYSDSDEIG